MPKLVRDRLTEYEVRSAPTGRHGDGNNLYLDVRSATAASWILRYRFNGRDREKGLGAARGPQAVSLENARKQTRFFHGCIGRGVDPLDMPDLSQPHVHTSWKLALTIKRIGGEKPPDGLAQGLDRARRALAETMRRNETRPGRSKQRANLSRLHAEMVGMVDRLDDPALLRLLLDDREGEDANRQARFGLLSLIERVEPEIDAIPQGPGAGQHGLEAAPHQICAELITEAWRLWRDGEMPTSDLSAASEACITLWEMAAGRDVIINTNTIRRWHAPLYAAVAASKTDDPRAARARTILQGVPQ